MNVIVKLLSDQERELIDAVRGKDERLPYPQAITLAEIRIIIAAVSLEETAEAT